MAAIPTAKAIYVCEEIDVEGGMTNLYALFTTIEPDGYPYVRDSFTVSCN